MFCRYTPSSLGLHYGLPWKTFNLTLFLRKYIFLHSDPIKQLVYIKNKFYVCQAGLTTQRGIRFPNDFPQF